KRRRIDTFSSRPTSRETFYGSFSRDRRAFDGNRCRETLFQVASANSVAPFRPSRNYFYTRSEYVAFDPPKDSRLTLYDKRRENRQQLPMRRQTRNRSTSQCNGQRQATGGTLSGASMTAGGRMALDNHGNPIVNE